MCNYVNLVYQGSGNGIYFMSMKAHVWAEESEEYNSAIKRIWNKFCPSYSRGKGVTKFKNQGSNKESGLMDMLGIIRDHHGSNVKVRVYGIKVIQEIDDEIVMSVVQNEGYIEIVLDSTMKRDISPPSK
jgi:hypothetical protein